MRVIYMSNIETQWQEVDKVGMFCYAIVKQSTIIQCRCNRLSKMNKRGDFIIIILIIDTYNVSLNKSEMHFLLLCIHLNPK